MSTLTDYLDVKSLQDLQRHLTDVTHSQINTYDPDGELICTCGATSVTGGPAVEATVRMTDRTLAQLVMQLPAEGDESTAGGMLEFLAQTLARLCRTEATLSSRVRELETVYRLTALFTGHRNLRHVLETVVNAVVEVMGVKSCGLRLLNRETDELSIEAVSNLSQQYLDKGTILLSRSTLDREALASADVVYVADERTDPRVMFPDEARDEGIVSALIVPLMYKGRPVGALRLYTDREYRFTDEEVSLIKAISSQAAAAIVNAQLHNETIKAENIRRQVRLAGQVQRRMIPAAPPKMPGLDLAAVYVPSLELSGDFYDFIELPRKNLGLVICDVMGKGVPAGLLTSSIRASLRAHAGDLYDMAEILGRVNRSMCDDTLTTSFATLFYGVINTATLEMTYSNAGHEPPLLIRNRQPLELTDGAGTVLGVMADLEYTQAVTQLEPGDVLLFSTDGLTEAMNFNEEQFGRDRVNAAAVAAIDRGEDANGIAKHLLWEMRRFAGLRDTGDDVTMVVVRVL